MLKSRMWLLMAAIFILIPPVSAAFDVTAQVDYPVLLNGAVEIETNVLIADITGDSKDEIVVSARDGRVYAFDTSGTKLWDTLIDSHAVFSSSPAAGNVICDADNEVVVGSGYQASNELSVLYSNGSFVTGWPRGMSGDIYSSPVLYDMDGDAYLEIIVGSDNNNLYVLNADGSNVAGWPQAAAGAIWSKPAVGDIDNDGEVEIIATSMDGKVYAWNKDGSTVTGWPVNPDGAFKRNEPAIGDIDGDGVDDVIVFTYDTKKLVGFDGSGSELFSYQVISSEVEAAFSSPSIGDADNDGNMEIIVGVEDGSVYSYDQNGFIWSYAVGAMRSKPLFADVTNDGVAEIIVSAKNGNLYAFYGDGTLAWSKSSGNYLWGSPSASDIDNDGIMEVVVGEWDGVAADLYVWNIGFTSAPPTVSITPSLNSTVYSSGDSISFTSSVNDVIGIRSISWSSNIDGILSTSQDFTKSSLSVGTHNITLVAVNLDGVLSSLSQVQITVEADPYKSPSGGGGSGGGGGGGGGGSSEDPDNIYYYETVVDFISNGKVATFGFRGSENAIVKVEFLAKTTAGGIATHIEMLNNTSSYASSAAPGDVYKNVNVWVGSSGFATPERISDSAIMFKVNKSWLTESGIDESTVAMCRFNDDMWNILPTEKIDDVDADDQYVYYVSQTPGFSSFAIISITEAERALIAASGGIDGNNIRIVDENGIDTSQNGQEGVTGDAYPSENKSYLPMPGFAFIFTIMIILFVMLKRV